MENSTRQEQFLQLYKLVQDRLESFTIALTRNREIAKDIAGETILIAYQQFDSIRSKEAFLSYLFTIATRLYRKRLKDLKKTEMLQAQSIEMLYDGTLDQEAACDVELLYQAMEKLPENQREAIIMFEISGFSNKEISEIQDSTLSAVKMRLKRARAKLAVLLGADKNE
jgi:RNA polymerase sigma-70 factor (ECF subfamily)